MQYLTTTPYGCIVEMKDDVKMKDDIDMEDDVELGSLSDKERRTLISGVIIDRDVARKNVYQRLPWMISIACMCLLVVNFLYHQGFWHAHEEDAVIYTNLTDIVVLGDSWSSEWLAV